MQHARSIICLTAVMSVVISSLAAAVSPLETVRRAEQRRIEVVQRIAPSVVCVFDTNQRGGGSGVLIDENGYGLTNFHVVGGLLKTRRGVGGLGDGVLYDLEVLGIDVTGDVAMFRLIPPIEAFRFPHTSLGDSDRVRVGDNVLVLGNPFGLSEDYAPTVTRGIVTGVGRYQEGTNGNLTYTDCLQVDASINPGNSGGPLFNELGEVIGINGRISVNTRGRFNVGFGYAISSNQIERFIPALRAGLLARHGTWEATVKTRDDGVVVFDEVPSGGPAEKAGIRPGDVMLALDGVTIASANHALSLLGTYPQHWPVLVEYLHDGVVRHVMMRLDPVNPSMRKPFEPDEEVNLRQVRRVIRDFQRVVLCDRPVERPVRWTWRVERTVLNATTDAQTKESYRVTLPGDGPAVMQRIYADDSTGRIIEYDASRAMQRARAGAEAFSLPPLESLILSALYWTSTQLIQPVERAAFDDVAHVGSDALTPWLAESVDHAREGEALAAAWNPRLLEVLEWSPTEQVSVRFKFDAQTRLLLRITVSDKLSNMQAEIKLDRYFDAEGMRWPTVIEVAAPGMRYVDRLKAPELVP